MPKQISILGATGSIGQSALDIIRSHPEQFSVYGLSAYSQIQAVAKAALEFQAKVVVLNHHQQTTEFQEHWHQACQALAKPSCPPRPPELRFGQEGLKSIATDAEVDSVVCAIVGTAGLASAYAAACAGKTILLANKEAMVAAGELFMAAVAKHQATVLPLDSEHNAIFQCLQQAHAQQYIQNVILTASGGPFRQTPLADLSHVTPEQACKHPNWRMGRKISVDSATMLNKGLEIIEAKWLFNLPWQQIKVLIHPESIVHSLVQYQDGSLLAQLGHADMRIPISYAMAYPHRVSNNSRSLALHELTQLNFSLPDLQRFPCLQLAYQAMAASQSHCLVLNAANEIAVAAFLQGKIGFTQIAQVIDTMLQAHQTQTFHQIDDVLAFDSECRQRTSQLLKQPLD
ncbi:1-deoxy-D-xylulose-5-phosphate reductoisomerase [Brackiella oedipodis]|uniref:1-deoxy-D-xylulose-5-phosphate reductoisomerase n=1 Tax=Brackiella oedipodis TaxID=124225 RepID=UPI00048BD3C5|nr:1-deoxy-D-xylulose-5-phosphate reductoisomerase [Brackiella oedipodis]